MSENQELQEENTNNNSKIIGSYLSLITKAESRYEGTLVEVDRVKKTMSLKNVKNMGTEGRRNGTNEQPPGDSILGMVKFRVDLIKTFEIIDKPEEEEEDEAVEVIDPAIVSSNDDQKPKENEDHEEKPKPTKRYDQRRQDDWSKGTNIKKASSQDEDAESDTQNTEKPEKKEYTQGQRQYQPSAPKVIGELKPVNDKYQKKFDEAYDFNKHQMSKDESVTNKEGEKKEGEETKTEKPKYDKNADFFDNITNSTLEPSDRGRGRGGRGQRGGYRGFQGGDEAYSRGGGGYRGRGQRGGYGENNREENGEWWNNRGRGSYRGNRGRGNNNYNYGDGTTGNGRFDTANGDRKKLYSDTLRDPNDPNFHKREGEEGQGQEGENKTFFDTNYRGGQRGRGNRGFRGGRGGRGGRPITGEQAEKRDEETFGTFTSQNFKFNHEQSTMRGGRGGRGGRGRGRGEAEAGQRGGRQDRNLDRYQSDFYKGINDYQSHTEKVVEDGHKDFFDVKKKPAQQSRAKNRFAAMMNPKKKKAQEDEDDSEEEVSNAQNAETKAD